MQRPTYVQVFWRDKADFSNAAQLWEKLASMRGSVTLLNVKGLLQFQLNFYPVLIPIFNVLDLHIVLISALKSSSITAEVETSLAENFIRFPF